MPTYKLTYFDFDGGRGEPIRIAFHAAGIEFEDHRIPFEEFMKTRSTMRFHCSPTLEVDGVEVTQSNAMLRYAGKAAGLYPEDDLQALYCDEAMGLSKTYSTRSCTPSDSRVTSSKPRARNSRTAG
jgi:glutathione S-transferase